MSLNPSPLACASSCRGRLACGLGLLLLLAGAVPATAREHVTVKLDSIVCVEESDEVGDDDAYLVAIGVNLRTGRTRALSYGCLDAASGDQFPVPSGQGIVFSDRIDHPSDLLVIVALAEFDANGFNTGYIMQGGENGLGRGLADRVQQQLDPMAKQYSQFAQPNAPSPDIAVQALRDRMRRIVEQNLGDDEFLGFYHIRMQSNGFWQNWATGDGARYQINFKRVADQRGINPPGDSNGKIPGVPVATSMLRFRIRDSYTKRPLPARVQLIRDGKMTLDRRATADGKFEQSVVPGDYRARFTMYEPNVSHHTLVKEVRVGAKDVYQDIYLKPLHQGQHVPPPPTSSLNLSGTWQATLFGQTITYQITQSGNSFNWSQPMLSEAATGTVLSGNQVAATLHGPYAPTPPVIHGTVKTDASGTAVEIAWNNGVRFVRVGTSGSGGQSGGGSYPPPPGGSLNLTGLWRASLFGQSIRYDIQQNGNSLTWNANQIGEQATGTISGTNVTATYTNPMDSRQVSGTIKTDGNGMPREIVWNNGVRFVRDL